MVIEMKKIVLAIPSLGKLSSLDLSLKTAYRLKRVFAALQKEADFFSEQRRKILDKYGVANADGSYRFEGENESLAQGELEELLSLTVSPDISPIDVPLNENIRLSVNDLELLAPFINFCGEE